jgi:hypothetical protein
MYCALAMVLLLSCIGIYSKCQRKPVIESVERDTVVVYDTVPHYYPVPKDSAVVRYVTKVLPVVRDNVAQYHNSIDTADQAIVIDNLMHDTVAVEVPITSKHYSAPEYDAWVSGYEANLDSLFVYQKKVLVTEIRTVSKPPNKVALFLDAGVDYTFNDKKFYPHAGGELVFNAHKRLQFAVECGVTKTPQVDGVNPYAGGKVKIRVF